MTALKRPVGEKSAGIGDWMIVWEIMSVVGIVIRLGENINCFSIQMLHYYGNSMKEKLYLDLKAKGKFGSM